MKVALVLLISGVLLVAYCTPLAAADDEVGEDDYESLEEYEGDDCADEEGLSGESRQAAKGAHARAGHAKHARAGSRHAASRAANRPHARSGAARRAAHKL
ncbi:uncharacterized protein LOC126282256 [Schistocerca gregaria]|uniref:uncharacterized protein LOC126282256 n=1 Tax=Schistocerca gregaria TaxID=7010 RepID=UPI00211E6E84|nr:uncharacterized protein LOC126282256 [Schistocerca gregaria]